MLKRLIYAGTSDIENPDLKEKIIITNQISLCLLVLVTFYTCLIGYFDTHLGIIYLISTCIVISILLMNKFHLYILSRFTLNFIGISLIFYSNLVITKAGEAPNAGVTLVQLAFAIIPFIIVSPSEKGLMALCLIINAVSFFLIREMAKWVEVGDFIEVFRSEPFEYMIIGTALIIAAILLFSLSSINSKSKRISLDLLEEMNIKNQEQQEDRQKLKDYIEQIEKTREESKEREWTATGLSKFSELLRNVHLGEQEMFDKLISELIKYIHANQGGLFTLERLEDREVLILKSFYAYERKKYLEKTIEIGEGLVGQTYLEKETILLTQLPDNYINITSGLGMATPKCVLILPLKVNTDVLGILEIASFNIIEKYKIDFLEKLGENIASTISIAKVNRRTQELLVQSQEQTEEMRSQEEEMRQNMEELQATQEEMQRKNLEYEQKIEELSNSKIKV